MATSNPPNVKTEIDDDGEELGEQHGDNQGDDQHRDVKGERAFRRGVMHGLSTSAFGRTIGNRLVEQRPMPRRL
jgi:hypothetical protein